MPIHMSQLSNLITKPFCKEIREKASQLEKENAELKEQLVLKQKHINETNKYWKKKMHNAQRKEKSASQKTSRAIAI
jgi:hypothetical protein